MEALAVFADAEWESFSKMFSTEDQIDDDLTSQYFGQCTFPNLEHEVGLQFLTPSNNIFSSNNPEANNVSMVGLHESLFISSDVHDHHNSNLHNLSQESSYGSDCSGSAFLPSPTHQSAAAYFISDSNHIPNYISNDHHGSMSMDICVMDDNKIGLQAEFPDVYLKETTPINEDMLGNSDNSPAAAGFFQAKELQLKRKFENLAIHTGGETINNVNSSENTKKRPRISRDVQKTKKNSNVQSKKNQNLSPKANQEGDQESNIGTGTDGQSSTSYSSEDDNTTTTNVGGATSDSKASGALNINGKARASRGSATDPQSLYARKRRERINERLKTLQHLVPNGTKVDISTMLEEAVHYVKFMQLQIKLLSSDDMWMYAPIAYNGYDVCLNQNNSPFL
ncbi:hypothetical protein Dsin_003119 [Dipteronia sinensis]|uniref:BHLH domain-containing protein n=1 Tax=Dipteronia sinensis TaxID=43782 RepID=A0AAE0B749_9ROSI|nr:hypothetical protein Dsin_003119 [Dipteronia sinensis]